VWLGGSSLETMGEAARRGWGIMRNFGANEEHRDALEHYTKVAAEHGHLRSGANLLIERFVAVAETEGDAERNLDRLVAAFGQFLAIYAAGGRRELPTTDGEFQVDPAAAKPNRPAIAISGTPEQVVESLQQTIDETGARRVLVETFSSAERRLFADEVMPALRERNAGN